MGIETGGIVRSATTHSVDDWTYLHLRLEVGMTADSVGYDISGHPVLKYCGIPVKVFSYSGPTDAQVTYSLTTGHLQVSNLVAGDVILLSVAY